MKPARILEIDREFSDRLRVAEQPGLLHTIAAVLAHSGDSWFWAIGLAAVYAAAPNARWAVSLFLAILSLAAVVMAVKFVVDAAGRKESGAASTARRSHSPPGTPPGPPFWQRWSPPGPALAAAGLAALGSGDVAVEGHPGAALPVRRRGGIVIGVLPRRSGSGCWGDWAVVSVWWTVS
jgi:hypothetical protein